MPTLSTLYRYVVERPAFLAHLARLGIPLYVRHIPAVTLEMTNACNLRCPVCPVPSIKRKKGFMAEGDFETIMGKFPSSVKWMRLNYAGEPLLHKRIFGLIKRGKETRPDIEVSIATNATALGGFNSQEIVDSGVDVIYVSIDGATKRTHEMYRVGSSFEQVTENVKALCDHKRRVGAKKPMIIQQTLLHKESAKEIPQIRELASKLGVDELALRYFTLPTLTCDLESLKRDWIMYSKMNPGDAETLKERFLSSEDYSQYERRPDGTYVLKGAMNRCAPFPFIMWNGDVATCCHDPEGVMTFGNLVRESWNAVMRRMPVWKTFTKQLEICRHCDVTSLGVNFSLTPVNVHAERVQA